MGFLGNLFGGAPRKLPYPAALQPRVEKAMNHLQTLTAAHDATWQLGQADWSVDQDVGTIEFTSPRGMIATAPVQIIGTYNTKDGTWLWGWDHPSVERRLREHAARVHAYGEQRGIAELTTRKLECSEERAWEYTALACKLSSAQGAYRGPTGELVVFMTFDDVKLGSAALH